MDYETLKKLQSNPHYKLNEKQLAELMEYEREPMVEIGVPPKHDNRFKTTKSVRRKKYVR